jgi:3-oxoacyl-[acyl-carrier protein] reductase
VSVDRAPGIARSERLLGRTALVTGAASGIGRAVAAHFLRAGARVVLLDRSAAVHAVAAELGADGAVTADLADEQEVARAVAEAEGVLGRIDVLVSSHGILTEAPVVDMDLATWQRTIDVDLTSVFLVTRAVLPGMLARRDGRIIQIASQLGQKGGTGLAHYAAAKAGVIAFTKSLALEVSASNVLANVIAPGPIETPLVDGISEDWKAAKRRELPLGRFGTVDEVAPVAVMLAADPDGNLFVGQTLGPNSGDVMP